MKVKMNVAVSGSRNGKDWPKIGGVVDLPESEARDYLESGLAALPGSDVESAVVDDSDVETATVKTKPRKRQPGLSKSSMAGDE